MLLRLGLNLYSLVVKLDYSPEVVIASEIIYNAKKMHGLLPAFKLMRSAGFTPYETKMSKIWK